MTPTREHWIHRVGFDHELGSPCCWFSVTCEDGHAEGIRLTPMRALELGRELVKYGYDYQGGALKTFARDAITAQ